MNKQTLYTVAKSDGDLIGRHMTLAEAADAILSDDSREYEIRHDGVEFTLWSRQQVANRGWRKTVVYSFADDRALAEAEIFRKVIEARWDGHPEAITDESYDQMQADLAEQDEQDEQE